MIVRLPGWPGHARLRLIRSDSCKLVTGLRWVEFISSTVLLRHVSPPPPPRKKCEAGQWTLLVRALFPHLCLSPKWTHTDGGGGQRRQTDARSNPTSESVYGRAFLRAPHARTIVSRRRAANKRASSPPPPSLRGSKTPPRLPPINETPPPPRFL